MLVLTNVLPWNEQVLLFSANSVLLGSGASDFLFGVGVLFTLGLCGVGCLVVYEYQVCAGLGHLVF